MSKRNKCLKCQLSLKSQLKKLSNVSKISLTECQKRQMSLERSEISTVIERSVKECQKPSTVTTTVKNVKRHWNNVNYVNCHCGTVENVNYQCQFQENNVTNVICHWKSLKCQLSLKSQWNNVNCHWKGKKNVKRH